MRLQTETEEKFNVLTHGLGVLLGLVGTALLLLKSDVQTQWSYLSACIYGGSMILLFSASTGYHAVPQGSPWKYRFRIFDHIGIYLLIAGTYTPILLLKLWESKGWILFVAVWSIAFVGLILKLFFTGRFRLFSTLLYLIMGWLVVFDYTAVAQTLGADGLLWLYAGGLFYTVGIVFYLIESIRYNHVIWHLFVLGGALSHFVMIYYYVY